MALSRTPLTMKATVVMLSALSRIVSLLLIAVFTAGDLVRADDRFRGGGDLEIDLLDIANDCRPVTLAGGGLRFATHRPQRIAVTKSCDCGFDPVIEWDYESIFA